MPNLDLKYITDENGNRVLPITHINAVRDSSGNTLPSLMAPEKNGTGIGTCSTSSGTALVVSLTNYELVQNGFIAVTFDHDVPASATLNVNGKGAKPIIYKGSAIEDNVIKEDDTVTFCYDGTNYVVTSLGGDSDVEIVEYLSINLICDDQSAASALVGATVVVTDDDNSETILSTTWQGTILECTIDVGINYTITVGAVTGYTTPSSKSFKARAGYTRTETFEYLNSYWVNLGLPSGTLWARGNLVKNGSTYSIGAETDWGTYVSWGNIDGHNEGEGYGFNDTNYNTTPGKSVSANISSNDATHDVCYAKLGSPWRLPAKDDFQELYDNTDNEWVADYNNTGVAGRKFMKKSDHSVFVFFPASGIYVGTDLYDRGSKKGNYWSSTFVSSTHGHYFRFYETGVELNSSYWRYDGCTIRPVK